jgi:hypothetical protein
MDVFGLKKIGLSTAIKKNEISKGNYYLIIDLPA